MSDALRAVAADYNKEQDIDFEDYARSVGVDVDAMKAEQENQQVKTGLEQKVSEPKLQNPQAGKEEAVGNPAKGVVYGLADAAQLAVNGAVDIADWIENTAAKFGMGSGDLITENHKVDWSSKLGSPNDGFETRAMRGLTKYGAPVVAGMGAGLLGGLSAGQAAVAGLGVQGAADFFLIDPKQERLADMIVNEVPEFKNYTVAYNAVNALASKPDDTEIESRFKNMLEGLAIGAPIAGALYGAVKWSTNAKRATQAAKAPLKPEVPAAKPAVQVADEATVAAAEAKMGANVVNVPEDLVSPPVRVDAVTGGVKVNSTSDEVLGFLQDYVQNNKDVDLNYTPGSFTEFGNEGTEILTNQEKLTALLSRRGTDRPYTPGEVAAGKQLLGTVNNAYVEAAIKASQSTDKEDLAAFVRLHDARNFVVNADKSSGSMLGAGLAAEKIAAQAMDMTVSEFVKTQTAAQRAAMIDDVLKFSGGEAKMKNLAAAVAALSEEGSEAAIRAANKAVVAAKGKTDAAVKIIEATAINGMLSSPKTVVANHINNAQAALKKTFDGYFAVVPGAFRGEGIERMREANDYLLGQMFSMTEMFANMGKAIKTGEGAPKSVLNANDMLKYPKFLSAESLGVPVERNMGYKAIGKIADTYGLAIGVPTRLNATADAAWGTAAYRGHLNQLAMKEVRAAGLKGADADTFLKSYLKDPPVDAHEKAVAFAEGMTFSERLDPDSWAGKADDLISNTPMGKVVFPFFKTSANVVSYTLNNSPIGIMLPNSKTRDALRAGGQAADMAIAQVTTGTLALGAAAAYASAGLYSGPEVRNPKIIQALSESGQGWQPDSVNVGGEWKDIKRFDYLNSVMRLGSVLASTSNYVSKDEYQQLAVAAGTAVADFMTPEMMVDSYAQFFDAFGEAVGGKSTGALEKFSDSLLTRMTPYSALSRDLKGIADPYKVDTKGIDDFTDRLIAKYKAINPWLSDDLPIQRNVFGEGLIVPNGALDEGIAGSLDIPFIPWASQKAEGSELVEVLTKLSGFSEQMGPVVKDLPKLTITMPPRVFSFKGASIDLTPQEYEKFVMYSAGKDPKTGQPDFPGGDLRSVMTSQLEELKPLLKGELTVEAYKKIVGSLGKTVLNYRKAGQAKMLEDPEIMKRWTEAQKAKAELKDFSEVIGE